MNNNTAEQKFENWKLIRRIGTSKIRNEHWLDSSKLQLINSYSEFEDATNHGHYALHREFGDGTGKCFPPLKQKQVQNFLDQLDNNSSKKDSTVLTDDRKPLVEFIRSTEGDLEPEWSDVKSHNPAELLLPLDQRLTVEVDNIKIDLTKISGDDVKYPAPYVSNSVCTFRDWIITANGCILRKQNIHDLMKSEGEFEMAYIINIRDLVHNKNLEQPESSHENC